MYPQVTQFETSTRLARQEARLREEREVRPARRIRRPRFGLGYALRLARR